MVGGAAFPVFARFEIAVQIESGVRSEVGATVVGLACGALVRAAGGAIGGVTGGAIGGATGGAIGGAIGGATGVGRIGAELESGI
jgi:hypothetical protein